MCERQIVLGTNVTNIKTVPKAHDGFHDAEARTPRQFEQSKAATWHWRNRIGQVASLWLPVTYFDLMQG